MCGYLLVVFSGCLLWLCRMLVNSVVCGNDLLSVVCVFDACVLLVWVGWYFRGLCTTEFVSFLCWLSLWGV